ncbi:MAG: hypothetical protein M0Z31_11405 [Clostridia bacterium]|nr:hypothetical protein [Clostridia bacterium]
MDILKKILYTLIGVLVIIVAAGGAYLGFNSGQMNQSPGQKTAQNQQPMDMGNMDMGNTQQQANQGSQTPNNDQKNNPTTPNQQSQVTGPTGQQPAQTPPATYPPVPPVRVIDPEPYYDRINKAREIIEDANQMISVDPFANSSKDPVNSGTDMSKIHQGIYKMSQGMTLMEETLDNLNKEIKGEAKFEPNPNQQVLPGYNPYQGYNQQNLPYSYNPQYPGISNPQQQPAPNQSNSQTNPQPQGNQPMTHGTGTNTGTANPFSNLSLQKTLTNVAYGILVASILGVLVAILGMVSSMFRKPNSNQG